MKQTYLQKIKSFLLQVIGVLWLLGLSLAGILHALWVRIKRHWY